MRESFRLNKYLSESGVCSRREADRLIEEGRVMVDGEVAVMGMKISSGQEVMVDGKVITPEEKMIVLAVNKPRGIVCTEANGGDVRSDSGQTCRYTLPRTGKTGIRNPCGMYT